MYFHSRAEAGRKLAEKLVKYDRDNTAVLVLSPGALIVGAQIAMKLHSSLAILMNEGLVLPGENEALGTVGQTGNFVYNNIFSPGQIEELVADYHTYIGEQKAVIMHRINTLLTHEGEIDRNHLRRHVVIVVSDGLPNGYAIDIAVDFLNSVAIKKLVIASPVASLAAVDRMHVLGDELCVLQVTDNYISTNHYYADNTIPPMHDMFKVMKYIALHWDNPSAAKPRLIHHVQKSKSSDRH